jgi:hypothetical protein
MQSPDQARCRIELLNRTREDPEPGVQGSAAPLSRILLHTFLLLGVCERDMTGGRAKGPSAVAYLLVPGNALT